MKPLRKKGEDLTKAVNMRDYLAGHSNALTEVLEVLTGVQAEIMQKELIPGTENYFQGLMDGIAMSVSQVRTAINVTPGQSEIIVTGKPRD